MKDPILQCRAGNEAASLRRRGFLQATAAWTATGGFTAAVAQQRGNIVELRGGALLNGLPLRPTQYIQTGDQLETGPGSHLVFVIGDSAFQLRENTRIVVERGRTLHAVSALRLHRGGVASVWGPGTPRQLVTPTLAAAIRGTGVYAEVEPREGLRTYFCNCFGRIELVAGADRVVSVADHHQSFRGEPVAVEGRLLTPAAAINHTDAEMEFLAQLVGQRPPWRAEPQAGK